MQTCIEIPPLFSQLCQVLGFGLSELMMNIACFQIKFFHHNGKRVQFDNKFVCQAPTSDNKLSCQVSLKLHSFSLN